MTARLQTKEDETAEDDHQRRPCHAVYHVVDRVHLLDDDTRRVHRVVVTLEHLGEAECAPPVGELFDRSPVVSQLLEADAVRTLQQTTPRPRFTVMNLHLVSGQYRKSTSR